MKLSTFHLPKTFETIVWLTTS